MNNLTYHNVTVMNTNDDSLFIFLGGTVHEDLTGISKTNCDVTITEHSIVVETSARTKTYKHKRVDILDDEDYGYFKHEYNLFGPAGPKFGPESRISEKHKKYYDMCVKYFVYGREIIVEEGFIFKKRVRYFVLPKKKIEKVKIECENYVKKIHNRNNLQYIIVYN